MLTQRQKWRREWYRRNKEWEAEYHRNYIRTPEGKEIQRQIDKRKYERNKEKILKYHKKYYKENFEMMNKRMKNKRMDTKIEVLIFYSGGKLRCACCNESTVAFLTLDHINNDGNKMRKTKKHPRTGDQFYRWLIENNFPKNIKLQVLCWNCNFGKYLFGTCPHNIK